LLWCLGIRSTRFELIGDVSVDGLAKALDGALALHRAYPANKAETELIAWRLREKKPGDKLVLTILRDGSKQDLTISFPDW
jgi:hypothetical protein